MKALATIIVLLASPTLITAEETRVHVGTVVKVSKDYIELDEDGSTVMIGFALDAAVVSSLERVKVGHEVRAVFGDTLNPDGGTINKLLSIRDCTLEDKECAADRARQQKELSEWEQRHAASEQQRERCRQAMSASLANDARYVPETTRPARKETLAQLNALVGAKRTCASDLLRQHVDAVLEACELHHCGDNVGGGCSHIAGRSMTSAAYEKAVEKCGT